ncbi:hypothetical protein J1TS5_03800 [Paenibacillus macerans]|uniref:LysM peptidoglycan-binding domain-containing protein n=1 Tax=Paenibacillus macerans TaxID=44252 RepID=UPI001B1455F3|nr:LysM peptidoglycan-binding domain-containing protein [Paenibacillus macerans]GIP08210.1 hypothetical protein J1TS5_03800 [Paenibacillus macerans]
MGSLNVKLNAKEIIKLKAVADYIGEETFTPPVDVSIGERAEQLPMKYPAVHRTGWNAAEADVPGLELPAQIWDMPADFSNLTAKPVLPSLMSSEYVVYYPRANPLRMVKEKDSDRYKEERINHFVCATKLNLTIRRMESASSVFDNYTYELVGVRESDMPLLERLMRHVRANPADLPVRIKLLYKDDAGRNEMSGSDDHWMFIQKANCSIETNPSESGDFILENLTSEELNIDLFIRRLWEGSVTRAGGFYLFHYDVGSNTGLPEELFENHGEAEVRLLFLSAIYENEFELRPYFNAVVTGSSQEGEDERSPIHVRLDQSPIQLPTDGLPSLQQLACTYYADVSSIVEANKLLPLAAGLQLQIHKGTYMVREGKPDDSASIALSLGIEEDDLLSANPGLRKGDKLEPSTAVMLPPLKALTTEGDHLAAISRRYGIPVAEIGADNLHLPSLFARGGTLELRPATRNRIGITPPGAVELRAERPAPEEWVDGEAFSASQYLSSMFQMLQPRIYRNFDFYSSKPGLPAGPKVSETEQFTNFFLADSPDRWQYSRTVPYAAFIEESTRRLGDVPRLPVSNPYVGAGRMLQLELQWLDLFGNRIRTGLDDFSADSQTPNRVPILVGYSDVLLGLSKWPFVSADYVVQRDARNSDHVQLMIRLSFDATPFQQSATVNGNMVCRRAQEAIEVYRTIMRQLIPDEEGTRLSFQWHTSLLSGGKRDLSEPNRLKLLRMLRRICDWLTEIASNPDIFVDPGIDQILREAVRHQDINASNLFELTVDLVFSRPLDSVSPLFRSSREVFEASTRILPRRSAESENNNKRSLKEFALSIEGALSRKGRYSWKLAVGTDRNRVAQSRADQSVWLVRIAVPGNDEGLQYNILNKEKPAIYAPKPIVNRSELFEYAQEWSYSAQDGFKREDNPNKVQKNRESMEVWAKLYLASVDRMLSPQYCSAMEVIRKLASPNNERDYGQEMIALKKKLAGVVSGLLDYVFRDDHPGSRRLAPVREIYRQRLLKELSNAYSIGAAIQFDAAESSGAARGVTTELCRLYGPIVACQPGDIPAGFALTNARLPMRRSAEGEMNRGFVQFVLSGSRVGAGAAASPGENTVRPFVELDVGYLPTHIEHQIEVLPETEGEQQEDAYQASSWLHFIVPPQDNAHSKWPLYRSLGSFKVPLILRAFPEEPQFVTQSFVDPLSISKKQRPLADFLKWDYRFTYRRSKHYAQDRVYFRVKFNEMITEPLAFTDMPDLCTQLARFNDVYGDLERDLNEQIGKFMDIPRATNDDTQHIERIFQNYLEMANLVADSWVEDPKSAKLLEDNSYRFHLSEDGIRHDDREQEDFLVVRLKELTPAPEGMKPPVVVIKGYHSILREVTSYKDPTTGRLLYTYEYAFQEENGTALLSAYVGQNKPEREVVLPDLNIVVNQNACLYSHITRNEELIDGRPLAEPYVYRTGEKRMARPIKPYLVRTERIEIAEVSGGVMPLEEHLSTFFKTLFGGCAPASKQKIQFECLYSYRISQRNFRPSLPITLFPPLEMVLTDLYEISDNWTVGRYNAKASMVCNLTSRLWQAFSESPPKGDEGSIDFKITIMTNQTADDVRLVDFQAISLAIGQVDPAPPLYDEDFDRR